MADTLADRDALTPPPQPGLVRGFALAIVAHLLLLAALTWGVHWDRNERELSAEAELWSAVPQEAAPKAVEPQPQPQPQPQPEPQPRPEPKPEPKPEPRPEPPPAPRPDPQAKRDAEIALEKQKKLEEDKRQAALEREREREKQRKEAEARKRERERKEAEARAREEERREQARLAAEKKRKEAEERKKREEAQEKLTAQLRQEQMNRVQGMAGATGGATARGSAARSSGPSDSWAGRVRARVKPNIVFTDNLSGNPTAEVEVRLAPDGTIVGKRLVKSSGDSGWDQAVLRALEKTEVLPRDVDGRVPTPVLLSFRPKD